jgi:GPH family glycoside/pentoside/hexuronide:cation symporter
VLPRTAPAVMEAASPATLEPRRALTSFQLLAYGLPGLPLAVLLLPLFVIIPTFYADELGLGLATVGGTLFFARIWDMVTDPLVGVLSDRTNSRFGRRKPWLVVGTPIAVLGAWALFLPPEQVTGLYLLFATIALYLGGTMIMLPYTAWAAELSPHHHERSAIAAAREVAIVVGTLIAIALPAGIGLSRTEFVSGTAWALLLLIPLTVGLAVLRLPDPPIRQTRTKTGLRAYAGLFRNRPFRLLVSAYFINGVAYGLPATLFLLYAEHVLGREDWSWLLLIIYFASAILGLPVWLAISRIIGKRNTWIAAMIMAAAGFWPAVLLGQGDLGWFVAICVITGLPLGAELVMPPSMQADVVDMDARESGSETGRAGTLFGIWGVATKVPLAVGVGIAFPLLAAAGFETGAATNDHTALLVLAGLYGLLPVLFKLVAIAIIFRFPRDVVRN